MNLLNFNISTGSKQRIVDEIIGHARNANSVYCCMANVHMFIEARKDPAFLRVVNEAAVVAPDGKPLSWALKLLEGVKQERVAGMDLFPDLLRLAQNEKLSVYFYGSTPEVLEAVVAKVAVQYPSLEVAGSFSPPFRTLDDDEKEQIATSINSARPRLLFVSLGCPKQEKWMHEMKSRIACPMIGVGGALPVFAGMQHRAPVWMQNNGLEWLYRLRQEPRRLFKRYAVTNSDFILLIGKEYFFRRLIKKHHPSQHTVNGREVDDPHQVQQKIDNLHTWPHEKSQ